MKQTGFILFVVLLLMGLMGMLVLQVVEMDVHLGQLVLNYSKSPVDKIVKKG